MQSSHRSDRSHESDDRFRIAKVRAREILDSKGRPTIETDVVTENGVLGRASAPCGVSTGRHEAVTLRDKDPHRYFGLGVLKAINNVQRIIAPNIIGQDVRAQAKIDGLMIGLDGTEDKSKLGGNAILSVSYAVVQAASNASGVSLYKYLGGPSAHVVPVPMFNLINGGPYSATDMDFQELLVMPRKAKSFSDSLRMGAEVYHELKNVLQNRYGEKGATPGTSGGYASPTSDPGEALDMLLEAIEETGYIGEFVLCLDCAASHLYDEEHDNYSFLKGKVTKEFLIDFYKDLAKTYPIFSIEDPLQEDDFEGHAQLTKELNIQIAGDDLFATNMERVKKGIRTKAANAVVLKPNQIGTITETLSLAQFAIENNFQVIAAARSSQPVELIEDIATAINCRQCKFGGPTTGERTYKYNRLLQIEEELGASAEYAVIQSRMK